MRLRLFLSFIVVMLVSIATVSLIARLTTAREVNTFMFRGGMLGVERLAVELEAYYVANHTWQGIGRLFDNKMHMEPGSGMGMGGMMNQRLRLADVQGIVVVDTGSTGSLGHLSPDELSRAIPLRTNRGVVGYLLPETRIAFVLGDQVNLLRRLNRAAIPAVAVGGLVSLLLSVLLTYGLLRPVRELTRATQKMAAGDLSQRVTMRSDGELATLGAAFNQMAESLEKAEESRRAMTADIAHELRTPLAVQRAHLEALQDGVYPLNSENLEPILAQNHLLTRLVEDLRTLALADAGQLTLERVPVDFPALVQRTFSRFSPQAVAKQIRLSFDTSAVTQPLPPLNLDPARIEQILSNLLANALRYTPEGGQIDLSLAREEQTVRLAIHDSGPGIPPEALPHLFERFYRADRARNRAEGGSGLGLVIARQLAQAQGGTIAAANHPNGGAVFTLELPLK